MRLVRAYLLSLALAVGTIATLFAGLWQLIFLTALYWRSRVLSE